MTIVFDRVSFTYPGSREPSLHGLSFHAARGQVTLLTGLLGAGCSTTVLVAAGVAPRLLGGSVEGDVTVLERNPGTAEGWRDLAGRVAVLLPTPWTQLSGMTFTVADEVAFGPANLGWDREEILDVAAVAMDQLSVTHLAQRDPATLSGGELQRVILAGLVAMRPDVYLLDEPTVELDPEAADAVYALLPTLAKTAAVLLTTTDSDRAVEVADSALYLESGQLVSAGSPCDVLGSERVVAAGAGVSVATLFRDAGARGPYPVDVAAAASRWMTA